MIEVYPKLFVGSQDDLATLQNRLSWNIVHAAKEPWHRQLVRYKGRDPEPNHPEFYVAHTPHSIALNMVDSPYMKHFYPQMMNEAINFISDSISKSNVLVHCNQGRSRGPGLAMYWMWKNGHLPVEEALERFRAIYPPFQPGKGMFDFLVHELEQ